MHCLLLNQKINHIIDFLIATSQQFFVSPAANYIYNWTKDTPKLQPNEKQIKVHCITVKKILAETELHTGCKFVFEVAGGCAGAGVSAISSYISGWTVGTTSGKDSGKHPSCTGGGTQAARQ